MTEFTAGIDDGATPIGIAAGSDGNIWFLEYGTNKVGRITPEGTVTDFTIPTVGAQPQMITAMGDALWFTEYGANKIGRITTAGDFTEFDVSGNPWGITAGSDGNVWFTTFHGSALGRITPTGNVTMFPVGATTTLAITSGPDGNLWFTEPYDSRVGRMTTDGDVTEFSADITPGSDPHGITSGPDGNLWFAEVTGSRIARITTEGVVTEFTTGITPGSGPEQITTGADGNLWFTEPNTDSIGQITPDGTVTEYSAGITNGAYPYAVALGADDNIWFTEWYGDAVGRIGPCAPPAPRPDARIKRGTGAFVGNDVYNTTGAGQTRTGTAPRGALVTYTIKVQNDATVADTLRLKGTRSSTRYGVTYTATGADITAAVTAGTYTTPALAPGATFTIRAVVKVKATAPTGSSLTGSLTAKSDADPTVRDTVKFVTRRS